MKIPKPSILSKRVAAPIARLTVLAVGLALSLFAVESYADDVGAFGGGGGGPFRTACEPGTFLVGFDTAATHVIDGIAPVCGDRRHDPLSTYGRPWAGGLAGTVRKPRCPADSVVTILHVFIDNGQLVNRVGFTCWNTKTNAMYDSFPDYGGEAAMADLRLICPQGTVGTGIYGRAGSAIDQLGLSCGRWAERAPPVITPPGRVTPPPGLPDGGRMEYPKPAKVLRSVDVFRAAGGNQPRIGVLQAGTPNVTLMEPCRADNWCHVKWPPAQEGWVYSGTPPDYQSLDVR